MAAGTRRWVLLRHGESPVEGRRCRATVPARMPARRAITSPWAAVPEGEPCASQGHVVRGVRVDWRHWPDRSGQFAPAAGGRPVLHRLSQRAL